MNTRELGRLGENLAKKFLTARSYKIIKENFWCRYGEVDLIAEEANDLVFIEVKLLKSVSFILPQEQVDRKKQEQIKRVTRYYLSRYPKTKNIRFDVVAINYQQGNSRIKIFKNAFYC